MPVLLCGALLVAAAAASVGVRIEAIALDETVHKQQAVHYANGFPTAILNDATARSTARLYSLALAPLFAAFDGDVAVRLSRVLNALLFCSAALPAYLLARTVVVDRRLAVAAGLLSVALPWLALSTALFTENLAYPLFVWVVWAVVRAVEAPSWRRDVLALALICAAVFTRTQLVALVPAYGALVAWQAFRLRRDVLRAFPLTVALSALGIVVVLALAVTDRLSAGVSRALGPYLLATERGAAPTDAVLAALFEVAAVALGVGVVPVVAALAWLPGALRRPPVLVGLLLCGTLWLTTLWAQGGFLGDAGEERYFFYVAPLVWIAALAALEDGAAVGRRAVVVATAVVALIFATVPLTVALTAERGFLAPAVTSVQQLLPDVLRHVPGLGARDALFLLTLGLGGVTAALWRHRRAFAVLAVPAALQLALTAWAVFALPTGAVEGVPPRTGNELVRHGWLDDAADGRAVTLLVNARVPEADSRHVELSFWNDAIRGSAQVPATGLPPLVYPLIMLGVSTLEVGPDGGVRLPRDGPVAQTASSPFVQLAGRRLGASEDATVELVDPGPEPRAGWLATGLSPDAWLLEGRGAALLAPGRSGVQVTLRLSGVAGAATSVRVGLGEARRTVPLDGAPAEVTLRACAPATGRMTPLATASLPDGRVVAARVEAVEVSEIARSC